MDLDQRIEPAARRAIQILGLDDTSYDGQYIHQDSERVSVHFLEGTERFTIVILQGGHPSRELVPKTTVEVLADQIAIKLGERQSEST
jgi:hypothetical protein